MDYTPLIAKLKKLIADLGTPVVITRLGAAVVSTKGAFVSSSQTNSSSDPISKISNFSMTEKTLWIVSTSSKGKPKVGDNLSCIFGSFRVTAVDEVNPAGQSIAFKLVIA